MPARGRQRGPQPGPDPGVPADRDAAEQTAGNACQGRPGPDVSRDRPDGCAKRGPPTADQAGDEHDSGHVREGDGDLHGGDGAQPGRPGELLAFQVVDVHRDRPEARRQDPVCSRGRELDPRRRRQPQRQPTGRAQGECVGQKKQGGGEPAHHEPGPAGSRDVRQRGGYLAPKSDHEEQRHRDGDGNPDQGPGPAQPARASAMPTDSCQRKRMCQALTRQFPH